MKILSSTSKKIICFLFLLSSLFSFSQEIKGWYGKVRAGYNNYTRVTAGQFTLGVGGQDVVIDDNTHSFGLNLISGYRFNDFLAAGIGIGLDGIHNPSYNTVPLFVDLRVYSSGNENPVYLYVNAGRHFDPGIRNSSFQTGGLFGIGVGYQFKIQKVTLQADVGFHTKNLDITPVLIPNGSSSLSLNGISFNLAAVVF